MDTESIARSGPAIEDEKGTATTRYGLEADLLPEESFYLVCAYDGGRRGVRRVLGKTASHARACRDVARLRAAAAEAA